MKLTYFQGKPPNFGDELNPYVWDAVLPRHFLDQDDSELFLGIGSILWDTHPRAPRKYVLGSGYGGYTPPPDIHDGSWQVVFVRGPRTASVLELPPRTAICDGAILLRTMDLPAPSKGVGIAYMPHYGSLSRGDWATACRLAGITMIDPSQPVEHILAQVRGADVLVTEAMHGAIVADALRVPWIAARPIGDENHMKWFDWSESLGIKLRSHHLRPSSPLEAYIVATKGKRYYYGRIRAFTRSRIMAPARWAIVHRAAARLTALSRQEPQLSDDGRISEATDRALEAVHGFVRSRQAPQRQRAI